jgi:hypothetical protein
VWAQPALWAQFAQRDTLRASSNTDSITSRSTEGSVERREGEEIESSEAPHEDKTFKKKIKRR